MLPPVMRNGIAAAAAGSEVTVRSLAEAPPIDQVIRSMSAAFGLKEEAAPPPAPADKKSYFINHLFTKIIFPDQTLARTSAKVQKRQKIVHFGTLGLSAVGTLLLTIALSILTVAIGFGGYSRLELHGPTRTINSVKETIRWAKARLLGRSAS